MIWPNATVNSGIWTLKFFGGDLAKRDVESAPRSLKKFGSESLSIFDITDYIISR